MASLCIMLLLIPVTSYASSYTNLHYFSGVVLPETSGNTTLSSTSSKTTSYSYGKAKITSYANCSTVSVWLRTKTSDGSYHYWTPYILDIDDVNSYHTVKYSDSSSSYYAKGVYADLRAENYDQALNIWTDKVSGCVYFN